MKVTDIEAIPVEIGLKPLEENFGVAPYATSYGDFETSRKLLVRVGTDEGISGWGETYLKPTSRVALAVVEDYIHREVVNRPVWEITSIVGRFTRETTGNVNLNINAYLGAVEVALWDALGKFLGEPVHRLIGGKATDRVEFAYCVGLLDPERSREHTRRAIDNGFETIKTKGGDEIGQDVARITAIDDEADGCLEIRVDPNQSWSAGVAAEFGGRLADEEVYLQYLEQPVRIDSPGTYRQLRSRLRQPVGVNEDTYHPGNFYQLLKDGAVDVGVIDLVFAGGFLQFRRLAAVGAEAGISMAHHSGFDLGVKTAAILHAVSATPAVDLPADTVYYALTDDVIESPFEFEGGTLSVPEEPGLGVTVDLEKVERYRIDD